MIKPVQKVTLGKEVTVGISAHGNYQTTSHALEALLSSAEGDFELMLVDDFSSDNTLSLFLDMKSKHANTRVLSFDRNLEYSGSLNAILSHATGDHILFVSNDIFVTPGYVREILVIARSNPQFGIVRGCSNFVDNDLETHNLAVPPDIDNLEKLFQFGEKIAAEFSGQHLVDRFLTGDAFLISRHVLEKVGTLDPLFYGYFADHDLGIRARIAGFELVLARGAFALHMADANFDYLPEDERNAKLQNRWARVYENWARFKLKYGLPVEQPYEAIEDIPWDALSSVKYDPGKHYCSPGDYSQYLL